MSETITRNDLHDILEGLGILNVIDVVYPVGSIYETTESASVFDPNVDFVGTWELLSSPRPALASSGSVTVNASQDYNVCDITLEPNTQYLVLAQANGGVGTSILTSCNIVATVGTPSAEVGGITRTNTASGQGVATWKYVRTGDDPVTVSCQVHGYYTTSHTETGRIMAMPINAEAYAYRWHRTA